MKVGEAEMKIGVFREEVVKVMVGGGWRVMMGSGYDRSSNKLELESNDLAGSPKYKSWICRGSESLNTAMVGSASLDEPSATILELRESYLPPQKLLEFVV